MADILTIAGKAALKLGIDVPTDVYGSASRENVELGEAFNDARLDILDAHDWQLLKTINTITGDGSTLLWSLPSDYGHLLTDPELITSAFEVRLSHISDSNLWLQYEVQTYDFVINIWTIYQDQVHTKPALGSAVTAKHWYISNLVAQATGGGVTKEEFDTDTDTFRLDDDLLRLGAIYKYRQNKGMPYAEEMADYEHKKALVIMRDGGSPAFRSGRPTTPRGVKLAYPQTVS